MQKKKEMIVRVDNNICHNQPMNNGYGVMGVNWVCMIESLLDCLHIFRNGESNHNVVLENEWCDACYIVNHS